MRRLPRTAIGRLGVRWPRFRVATVEHNDRFEQTSPRTFGVWRGCERAIGVAKLHERLRRDCSVVHIRDVPSPGEDDNDEREANATQPKRVPYDGKFPLVDKPATKKSDEDEDEDDGAKRVRYG